MSRIHGMTVTCVRDLAHAIPSIYLSRQEPTLPRQPNFLIIIFFCRYRYEHKCLSNNGFLFYHELFLQLEELLQLLGGFLYSWIFGVCLLDKCSMYCKLSHKRHGFLSVMIKDWNRLRKDITQYLTPVLLKCHFAHPVVNNACWMYRVASVCC